jgi:ABC-type antimicrobial peptide transport system permease subunit
MRNTMIDAGRGLREDGPRQGLSRPDHVHVRRPHDPAQPRGLRDVAGLCDQRRHLVEIVFNYPGLGFTLLQAVHSEDYALMQTLFLIALAVLVAVWPPIFDRGA